MAGEDWYMERSLVFTDNISVMVATADRNHRLNFLTSDLIPRKSEEVRRGFHCSVINDNVQLLQCLRVEYATIAFFFARPNHFAHQCVLSILNGFQAKRDGGISG